MSIGQIIHFHNERFFEGAVQLSWVERRKDQARQAAEAFVFHGPRYHGAGDSGREGVEETYKLKDTAGFVRDLLGSMSSELEEREVNPYWLVVAGYGSGKSHLALTCSMLLTEPTGETAQVIVNQIAQADPEIGEVVAHQVAEMGKPALVLSLDGMAGFHLGNALSRSVFQQFRDHGVDAGAIRDLSPRFQTAEQFVDRNFSVRTDSFRERLPDLTAEQICTRLRENDEAVYTAVDEAYSDANGHPIPIEGQESSQELIDTLCSVYCGKDGPFSNVVILFDELGRYLEYASQKPQLAGDFALQQIFQGVQDNSSKVRFIGFIQYELKAYLKRFSGSDLRQLQRYITRFDTAEKWYLSTNLETIFAHMIGKDEEALSQLWNETGAGIHSQRTWQCLSPLLPGFSRYPVWSDPERFERIIAKGCWPLHPFAVWFLTRQRDLVQSRSALTFIKDVIDRITDEDAQVDGHLRQVSAADLVVSSMLPELLSAERETGGTTAETLQMLLEKFSGHLNYQQQMVLAGVAVIEKTRVGKQSREIADALLCEATPVGPLSLPKVLEELSELGAVEWNDDLGQYELLSDGATRGQFQQWLRTQQAGFDADGIRDLFVRRGSADIGLEKVAPDFAQSREISTPDWFFEAHLAHVNTVENTIRSALENWQLATSPKDAKGKVIYLYLHPDDDVATVGERVQSSLNSELEKVGQSRAPVWVIGIEDRKGALADHIGRLYLFDELMPVSDQERFRRFVADERERSSNMLKESAKEAIRDRHYWIAGFPQAPSGRLRTVGLEIFNQIYLKTVPFPFDGFGSAAGGGPADSVQLARGLIARQVNGPWVQAQPKRLQNRINAVLIQSWKGLSSSGKLVVPSEPGIRALIQWLEKVHRDDPEWTLLNSYRALIAPPYGMNASSASVLLGLFLGLNSPPRRVEQDGELVASSEWLQQVFPARRGQHYLDEVVLAKCRVCFLSDDSEGLWRNFLAEWETEKNYEKLLAFARKAEGMREVDPLPETFEGNYKYLCDATDIVEAELQAMSDRIEEWERGIEKAERKASLEHAIRIGSLVMAARAKIVESGNWPDTYLNECDSLLALACEQISPGIDAWIPRQNCRSATQVAEFRQQKEREARGLISLGFKRKGEALIEQAQKSISRVEKLQQFSLTLAQCDDYPRQPEATASTTVRHLRDEIAKGDELVKGVQGATGALTDTEIRAYIQAIKQHQEKLKVALTRQQGTLVTLYDMQLDSQQALHEVLTKINHLRDIFIDTPDESDIGELTVQLQRVLSDISSWGDNDVAVDRLEELLMHQVDHQLTAMGEYLEEREIDPAWDMSEIYKSLAEERLEAARRRSAEWAQPRLALAEKVKTLDQRECASLTQELGSAPAYLSHDHAAQIGLLLQSVESRLADLQDLERSEKVAEWLKRYHDLADVEKLDHLATEKMLSEIRNPPCELRSEELVKIKPIANLLTAHLDQMSMDDLFARIELLQEEHQRHLLKRLAALLDG